MKLSKFFDLNYCSSIKEEHPGVIGEMVEKSRFHDVFKPILRLLFNCLNQLNPISIKNITSKNIETVVVICTLNQYRALENLIQNLPNIFVISIFPIKCKYNLVINTNGNCLVSLINLPRLLLNLLGKKGFDYKAMIYHFDDYLNTPGVYNHAEMYLKSINPKSIIVANDHTFFPRSYFRAAQKLGIKTIYTQHASVSRYFPNLEYDYVFLDGQETLDKYTSNGRTFNSKVFFSGSPRFDKISQIKDLNRYDLGVAINLLDNEDKVLTFLKSLMLNNINFALRPHPSLSNISFWKDYCKSHSIGYSDPLIENPISFISSCNFFVVGDSAFHLEVALCNKVSYFVNFQNNLIIDWYEFVRNGLVKIKTEQEVISFITNKTDDKVSIEKVQYYVANFSTKNWGNSTALIKDTVMEINNGSALGHWKSISQGGQIFQIKH